MFYICHKLCLASDGLATPGIDTQHFEEFFFCFGSFNLLVTHQDFLFVYAKCEHTMVFINLKYGYNNTWACSSRPTKCIIFMFSLCV